ncbi:MAG: RNA polymerase sigma factor [Chitinivibrionales bacterium]|nr:RNA polymerase sigma factor [Chitinivibrionales bacterium]
MADSDKSSDYLWIDEVLQGRTSSFDNIIIRHQDRIYTLTLRSIRNQEDAKDITQNVFFNAFIHLEKFRKESSLQTWLYRIALNEIKNYWRSRKRRCVIAESELASFIDNNRTSLKELSDSNEVIESEASRQAVRELISFLPLEQRQFFVLYYCIGHTCQEIADIFKTSASNVKIQLFRGRQYLLKKCKEFLT